MDVSDVVGQVRDVAQDERARAGRVETQAAIVIAVLAMLLAIASVGGQNASKEMVNSNILASDTWAFFQAKSIRQTNFRLAAEELELLLPSLPVQQQAAAKKRFDGYEATVARYESEPDPNDPTNPIKGDGKKELMARARHWEGKRDHAQAQDPNFDYAAALYQIAVVLGSVAIVAVSRRILVLTLILGASATVLMLNGFFLFFDLPIG